MNKDDFDLLHQLRRDHADNVALNLIKGLHERQNGFFKKNFKSKENVETFAEEEFIRKKDFNELRCEMPGIPRSTFLMVFSPDGSKVASTHGNHNIYITDLRNGKNIRTLVGHPRTPWCIAFHPTSDQIVASGCLGGQVRIWDLSGGSEVWTAVNQTVIASLAFHPNDRVLAIATYNGVYFWDWSQPEPFVHAATYNVKEKVRYVAFDALGHKLITGIANSPMTRWERVRAPVPVPRQERCASPYRRRITQRLVNSAQPTQNQPSPAASEPTTSQRPRDPVVSYPERERRIALCYRTLVKEYEQLVQRYLQLYRPPLMIDRGTDPMEPNNASDRPARVNSSPNRSSRAGSSNEPEKSTSTDPMEPNNSFERPARANSPPNRASGGGSSNEPEDGSSTDPMEPNDPSERPARANSSPNREPAGVSLAVSFNTDPMEPTERSVEANSLPGRFSDRAGGAASGGSSNETEAGSSTDPMEPNNSIERSAGGNSLTGKFSERAGGSSNEPEGEPSTSGTSRFQKDGQSSSAVMDSGGRGGTLLDEPSPSANTSLPPSPSKSAHNLLTPSRIFSVIKKPSTLIRGTQTSESKKHKQRDGDEPKEKRFKKNDGSKAKNSEAAQKSGGSAGAARKTEKNDGARAKNGGSGGEARKTEGTQKIELARRSEVPTPRRMVVINMQRLRSPASGGGSSPDAPGTSGFRLRSAQDDLSESSLGRSEEGDTGQSNVDELLSNIRRTAEEEVRNRILPIIRSVPANDRPELIRLFENSREHVRMRFRRMYPCPRKFNRLPIDTTSDSSSSDDEQSTSNRLTRRNSEPSSPPRIAPPVEQSFSSTGASSSNPNVSASGSAAVRNFDTELEQLVTSILTEIERNETVEGRERTPDGNTQTAHVIPSLRPPTINWAPPPYRPRPLLVPPEETTPPPSQNASPLPTSTAGSNLLFQEIIQLLQNRENGESPPNPSQSNVLSNTNTRTTNSTVYTTSSGGGLQLPPRRRFFSHRISAFMPTRVNYTRSPSPRLRRSPLQLYRGMRLGSIGLSNPTTFGLDELINYSELENSEDDPPPPPPPPDENHPADPTDPESDISSMYSNIVQELESSLENVVRLRVSTRPGETSNMLSSFSERLESILNQSSVILRNLTNSMEMLTTSTSTRRFNTVDMSEPNTWNYFDPTFYVRSSTPTPTTPPTPPTALPAPVSPPLPTAESPPLLAPPFDAVVADHTYPRHAPEGGAGREGGTPMVATVHLTILHIQRQARLLRQQVEVIEQIDRAMLEVEQLQLVRHLVVELVRHVRTTGGGAAEDTAPAAGSTNRAAMSSVRQMMAGTRISDSSPYDSPAEEGGASGSSTGPSSATSGTAAPSTSGNTPVDPQAGGSGNQTNRQRSSSRKTYPPSRMFRLAKQCRRPSVLHFFSRRNSSRADRGHRQNSQSRPANRNAPTTQDMSSNRFPPLTSIYSYDSNRLAVMTRRLEQLLTEQMRAFTSPDRPRAAAGASNRSTATIDLGEHILALRLHGCVLRMNRVLGYPIGDSRADPTAAVTRDGVSRYNARHLLSLVIDSVSRHVEELGQSDASASTRAQTHGVLAMSLLLTELLLLVVVDSIPPPSGIDFNPERGALASRIDQLCGQMLQNRQCTYSQQLTRSLRLMRLTMRHAHSALGQTYHARRNAMLPRHSTDRRLLLGSINRCLRTISRRRQTAPSNQSNTPAQDAAAAAAEEASTAAPSSSSSSSPAPANQAAAYNDWYSTISDLIGQYSTPSRDDDADNRPSTSGRDRVAAAQNDVSSNNDNSDDDDNLGYSLNTSSNLYRANNINLAPSSRESSSLSSTSRPWNVPSVHVNDVPVTEPTSSFAQRLMSQRQRAVADRMSELRSNQQPPGGGGGGLFRPRFLHPFYASVNPFDADLDDAHRDQVYDSDMVTTVTPNHRIQAWDVADWSVPNIGSPTRNVVVSECKIHNDASVDIAKDGTILVTLLPSGGYLNVTNRLGVYSLRWETLGQCLYTTSFEQNAVSVSLSPLGRHLVVGLASRIVPSDRWIMARVFKIEQKDEPGDRLPVVRELEQSRDSRINCIRWLPSSGQGLIYATNTGQLVVLT